MIVKFEYIEGATPIDPDEAAGLIPKSIMLQSELNEWEQSNILEAEIWLFRQKISIDKFSTIEFMQKSHQKMFDKTWRWAGQFRVSNKNIGIDWHQVRSQLKNLCDDLNYQVANNTYPIDEIAIRFHHRLVSIHCFANGNGRHARIMTDFLLHILGHKKFTWGMKDLVKATKTRKSYISALKQADSGKYLSLLSFARS